MKVSISQAIEREWKALFQLKKTERLWHIPVLASLCVGIPLLAGVYFDKLNYGIIASTGGLVILYLPGGTVATRMITLIACSFGFMVAMAISLCFSFNPWMASIALGCFAFAVHWVKMYFHMKPPGSFFFIMIASIGSCMKFDLSAIPTRVGLIGMGTMLACILAFFYSLYITRVYPPKPETPVEPKKYMDVVESIIVGVFMVLSILVGHLLHLNFPYWLPISCAAVMQGVSLQHVWQRSFHRILGTFVGLGFAWLLLQLHMTPLNICLSILVLQFIIEVLVVRHYALAVIFITPLTLFLAEAGGSLIDSPNQLITLRFLDITLGSLIGALGGWVLYHEQLYYHASRQLRRTKYVLTRMRKK
ncbi:FUSC family protein [Paraflavitalea pollutisoli]|uniref:FUSC family protein n=1 Tax=Paraflavitalea pollutisoli TaxID=3034143 RepID=UPI0023EB0B19|nr:FUSC family protein [Paraflavitalea sp. H1-2-19X]